MGKRQLAINSQFATKRAEEDSLNASNNNAMMTGLCFNFSKWPERSEAIAGSFSSLTQRLIGW